MKSATVTVCHMSSENLDSLTSEYFIKYDLGTKSIDLHMDAEMMTWGAKVTSQDSDLVIALYWPSDKVSRRKIREFRFACGDKCSLTKKCEIERLKTDIPTEKLLQSVSAVAKGKHAVKMKSIDSPGPAGARMLDQLFAEALSGNKKAKARIEEMSQGTDGGNAEIMGTYLAHIEELASEKCHWQK